MPGDPPPTNPPPTNPTPNPSSVSAPPATFTVQQLTQVKILKAKLVQVRTDIKEILEIGRLIAQDDSQLYIFKGMVGELKSFFEAFNSTWDKLVEIYTVANLSDRLKSDDLTTLYSTTRRYYYEACAIREADLNKPAPMAQNSTLNESRTVRARLPQINLPQFSGDHAEWPLFRDTFKSLIHEEPTLSPIERFHFLVSCLRGHALSTIKAIPLQGDTYQQAWEALVSAFDNKRRLAGNYLKTILEFPPLKTRPTAGSLQQLISTVMESIEAFKHLQIPVADDFILLFLALRCLEPSMRREFEREVSHKDFPKMADLTCFLRNEWKSLELTSDEAKKPFHASSSSPAGTSIPHRRFKTSLFVGNEDKFQPNRPTSKPSPNLPGLSCPSCHADHSLYRCDKFRSASIEERLSHLKNWTGCKNCLSGRHRTSQCKSPRRCQYCNKAHHSWLHKSDSEQPSQSVALSGVSKSGEVVLGTALVKIRDSSGRFQTIRLVTDCGSQHSFITHKCVKRLGLSISRMAPQIAGIGQVQMPQAHGILTCKLKSRLNSAEFISDAIVVPEITGNLPHSRLSPEMYSHFNAYTLADPSYWKPQEVDFLLGADLYFDLVTGAPIEIREDFPKLVPTKLGHIVAGRCHAPSGSHSVSLFVQSKTDLHDIVQKFWEMEELPKDVPRSAEEDACEIHFVSTHYRLPTGRYVVSLPLRPTVSKLQCPKNQVLNRFRNLESRLSRNPALKAEYCNFMEEYLSLSHMQPTETPSKYLIPHHCVSKIEQGKAKIRVVFDASCRSSSGSLNDHLLVGAKLQRDIADIILSFRTHAVVLVADIVKMYRQVLVRPEDRPYQHIYWRNDPKDQLQTMELGTVTYGMNSSSFLAIRTLFQLAEDEGPRFPRASEVLHRDIYVDDIVTGESTVDAVLSLQEELIGLLKLGGFELSKWKSNQPEVLKHVERNTESSDLSLSRTDNEAGCKILGLLWNSTSDAFTFEFQRPTAPNTKRGVLSTIARIYDPLGFLAPVVFQAKTILQALWQVSCEWDEIAPPSILAKWISFANELETLSGISISRLICTAEPCSYSLIGFSDASCLGYSAALYLRASTASETRIHLLKAKTKLAPTRLVSIPRLELCGALLLSRLLNSCKPLLVKLNIQDVYLHTDSTVVLGWLRLPLNRLKAFVAHRVSEICDKTKDATWLHVQSEHNPADCASRGVSPSQLREHPLWWAGPQWLQDDPSDWPSASLRPDIEELPETRPLQAVALVTRSSLPSLIEWMEQQSSYMKLIRVLCHALRFIKASRQLSPPSGTLRLAEITDSSIICVKLIQQRYILQNEKLLSSKTWKSLTPFQDAHGVLRVGGRLEHAKLRYNTKHPTILPRCHYTNLLVDHFHRIHLHVGPSTLQGILQGRFYILSARKVIRARLRHCVTCQISNSRPKAPLMGSLPPFRLEEGQIFQHVGVDLGGPFPLKESNRRKAALGKSYLCLFICMVTKAVHLEVVSSCSTEAFIAALHRFTSRRGRPRHMYSDCGTNFAGAASELQELKAWYNTEGAQDKISKFTAEQDIEWHFNPPRSPHFGGIWEAGIKVAKTLLTKNLSGTPLTFEELSTLFSRIEAVLNSRPLCPSDNDPEAIECLTPGHFLIGRPITALPEESLLDVNEICLRRWKLVQQRVQHFWSKWRSCYLNQLIQRRKWTSQQPNISEGDLVIIKDADCPPTRWPIARVLTTHPGHDGIVRVVTIKTPTGIYKRPIAKLSPLFTPDHMREVKF